MPNGSMSAEQLAELRGAVVGPVLAPGETGYEKSPPAWQK